VTGGIVAATLRERDRRDAASSTHERGYCDGIVEDEPRSLRVLEKWEHGFHSYLFETKDDDVRIHRTPPAIACNLEIVFSVGKLGFEFHQRNTHCR